MISWKEFNSEESVLPFYLPLGMWITIYVTCIATKVEFHKWNMLHNLHNIGAVMLGITSLYNYNDDIFNERIAILWSLSYFLVDLFDCVIRLDYIYSLHATLCLVLGYSNYSTPACRLLRTNAKASLCEISNPFMHLAKKTRKPAHFLLFVVVFTCCRILWVPVIIQQMHEHGHPLLKDYRQFCLMGFYGLNLFWYSKMIRILLDSKKDTAKEE